MSEHQKQTGHNDQQHAGLKLICHIFPPH
ncbi:MAG: hypothetical protein ACQETR_12530 [Thermodesulfobacteriota bacterium]